MKKIVILAVICIFCIGCKGMIFYSLENKQKSWYDAKGYSSKPYYSYEFGIGSKVYSEDNPELKKSYIRYKFNIGTDSLSAVKLNSVTFKRKKDGDTIPTRTYIIERFTVRNDPIPINEYPFIATDKVVIDKRCRFLIIVESTIPEEEQETKRLYISFDIEVGSERIIKKNIEYKMRLITDIRPKW